MRFLPWILAFATLVSAGPCAFGTEEGKVSIPQGASSSHTALSVEDLVRRTASSVVAILVDREEVRSEAPRLPRRLRRRLRAEKDLRDYFQRPDGPASGLLLDREGHVLTTHYNVAGTVKSIKVILPDGTTLPAKTVARDPNDDMALIRVEGGLPRGCDVPQIRWGSGESIVTGRIVIAVGRSPAPAQATATIGIISAPSRNHGRAFQTDAALNYGNVGGVLVDLQGNVLGVAAFVGHTYPHWGQNSGIGFGVRADIIQEILPSMLEGQDIPDPELPFLGVRGPSGPDNRGGRGAPISGLIPGSAAALGGIRANDVILEFDSIPVEDFTHLRYLIFAKKPGDEVALKVQREDKVLDMKVTLKRRAED